MCVCTRVSYVCVCVYACVYVCMYMCACMYACMFVCVSLCICVYVCRQFIPGVCSLWPRCVERDKDDDTLCKQVIEDSKEKGWCTRGECVVIVSGQHGVSGSAHMLRVVDVE